MSSGDGEAKAESGSVSKLLKNIDKNTQVLELIKRFFYQILGIYVPATYSHVHPSNYRREN